MTEGSHGAEVPFRTASSITREGVYPREDRGEARKPTETGSKQAQPSCAGEVSVMRNTKRNARGGAAAEIQQSEPIRKSRPLKGIYATPSIATGLVEIWRCDLHVAVGSGAWSARPQL